MKNELLPTIDATILLPEGKSDITRYILLEDFTFSGFTVPKGFVTDGATIPKIFWNILPPVHRYFPAAIVHDYLLSTGTRSFADRHFKIALKELDISKVRRFIMHAAVRLNSRINYPKD